MLDTFTREYKKKNLLDIMVFSILTIKTKQLPGKRDNTEWSKNSVVVDFVKRINLLMREF